MIGALFCLYAVLLIVLPLIGIKNYSLRTYFLSPCESLNAHIVYNIRLPRVLLAYIAGAILSLGGMVFQSIFRNPLATPFTLGVSSGCSFGAALYLSGFLPFTMLNTEGKFISALLGGVTASLFVYLVTRAKKEFHGTFMLLAGVAVTLFFSSMVMLIQYLSNFYQTFMIFRWLVGGLDSVSYAQILKLLPISIGGFIIIFIYSPELDLMLMGNEIAVSKGLAVKRFKLTLFAVVSLMISFVVSVCGPIAFVGMIVPHICRLIIGPQHKYLTMFSILAGGIFLAVSDTLARSILPPTDLPVGIITAFLGGPFFLWILASCGKNDNIPA
ncbi:iron ABC transporter permease [bacterium]|nr:iron ABC transporter permease [bacterium]